MKKHLLLLTSLLAIGLVSCGGGTSSGGSSNEGTSSSEPFISVDWDTADQVNTGISQGGSLIDIAIGKPLCKGITYTISFSFSDATLLLEGSRVECSNNGVMEVEATATKGSYNLNCLLAGESILKIYDAEGVLHYRDRITVRRKLEVKELDEFMVNTVDHFESSGYNGKANITFVGDGSGIYSGHDGSTVFTEPIEFTYEYTGLSDYTDDEYCFTVTSFKNDYSDLVVVNIYMDFTGGLLHPVDRNTVVDFFYPVYA